MNANSSISTHDPWLPLPPKSGKGGTNETLSNYRAFQVYGCLVPSERSLPRTAQILRRTRGPMERLSIQFDWAKRAGAWDCRRAEISAEERTAAVIAATRKQVEQRAGRWGEYREKVWIDLRQLIETVKQLTSKPIIRVRTVKRARPNAKEGPGSLEITSLFNPALDMLCAIHALRKLAQQCFGDLKLADGGPAGTTQTLTDEVKEAAVRLASLTPSTIRRPRDPWLPLLPEDGKGGTTETPLNYQAFDVYARLTLSERSLRRTAQILGKSTTLMERWSGLFDWPERARAWDRRLAEIAAQEWTAAMVAANRKEDEKWARRWVEFHEEVWIVLRQLTENLKHLTSLPLLRVQTVKRATPATNDGPDSTDVTWVIDPALDGWRAVRAQTELAQLCFDDWRLADGGPDGTTENLKDKAKEGVDRLASLTPSTICLPRDPWLPLPPKGGKSGTTETPLNYEAFDVYARLTPSERSIPRAAEILGKSTTLLERWSGLFDWPERARAWDRRIAELSAQRTAAVVAANGEEDEKWARRWVGFREDAWIELSQLAEMLTQLLSRPLMLVQTVKFAKPNAKDGPDSMEITSLFDPATDGWRAVRAQTELAQLCFGDLKVTDGRPDTAEFDLLLPPT